jgi:hypothetical protein
MDYITKEVIAEARKALEANNWEDFFDAFGFKIYGDIKDAKEIELESYTDGGGDMIISIDVTEDWQKEFREYVENYDIDNEVHIWWPDGQPGKGVPFNNIRDLYNDIEEWVDWLKDIIRIMDGKEPLHDENGELGPSEEELKAVYKWVYFTSNYPNDFIEQVWGEGWFADHIKEKFYEAKDFNTFYRELDGENQEKLTRYVLTTYNP